MTVRIAELISLGKLRPAAGVSRWQSLVARPLRRTVFDGHTVFADEVARYLVKHYDNIHDSSNDVPAHLPPFESLFVEFDTDAIRASSQMVELDLDDKEIPVTAIGVHYTTNMVSDPRDVIDDYAVELECKLQEDPEADIADLERVCWIVEADFFAAIGQEAFGPLMVITYFCDERGVAIKWMGHHRDFRSVIFTSPEQQEDHDKIARLIHGLEIRSVTGRVSRAEINSAIRLSRLDLHISETHIAVCNAAIWAANLMDIPAFAVGLMHCKNVEVEDAGITHAGESAAEVVRQGGARVRYKVLKLHPMMTRVVRQDQDDDGGVGLNPLHIVRGHFRDYRNGKGLFGKHRGIYWWTPHMRGDESNGVVTKDYAIQI